MSQWRAARSSLGAAFVVISALVSTGCASGGAVDPEAVGQTSEELRVELGRRSVAYDFASRENLVHGVAGDERLVFVTEPLNGTVAVHDRVTGNEVGRVPAPPDGWLLPFTARVARSGRLVVSDPGGFPDPTAPPPVARVYDYDYQWNPITRRFSATLVRTVRFDTVPVAFAEDMEVLPNGDYVLSDSILGALWVIRADGSIAPGIVPDSFAPGAGVPLLAPCGFPGTTVGGVTFTLAGNFGPGVGSLAADNTHLYFGSTCEGGVHRVPIASLYDTTRTPAQRGADIRTVSPRPAGTLEVMKGLTFNRYDSRERFSLYAMDPLHLRVLRIDVRTGAREVIADDPVLFNFPVAATFLPPVAGLTPLVVASDQEHLLAGLNASLTTNQFQPPFLLTKVYVLR